MIKIRDLATKEVKVWTIEQVLTEINRDRSDGWVDYDESDWLEGWMEWVEGDFYHLITTDETCNGLVPRPPEECEEPFNCDMCLQDIDDDMYELDGIQVCKGCYEKETV